MEDDKIIDIERIRSILQSSKTEIRKKYKADILGVFGSYSRGEAEANSDIDVLVRFEKGASLFDWAGLVQYLKNKLGVSVDVVSEKSLKKELRPQIFKDLIEV